MSIISTQTTKTREAEYPQLTITSVTRKLIQIPRNVFEKVAKNAIFYIKA
jgi:hypothetical protein